MNHMSKYIMQVRWYLSAGRRMDKNYSEAVDALTETCKQRILGDGDDLDVSEVSADVEEVLRREKRAYGIQW